MPKRKSPTKGRKADNAHPVRNQFDAEVYLKRLSESVAPFINDYCDPDPELAAGQKKYASWIQQRVTETFIKLSLNQIDDAIICAMDAARLYEALRFLPLTKESHADQTKWWTNSKAAMHFIQQRETQVPEASAVQMISRACRDGTLRSCGFGKKRRIDPYTLELWIAELNYLKNNSRG